MGKIIFHPCVRARGINLDLPWSGTAEVTLNHKAGHAPRRHCGAIAADEFTPVNPAVIITGSVHTANPGTYNLSFNTVDAAGNDAMQVQRTVTVAIANPTAVGADGLSLLTTYALGANSPIYTVQAPVVSAMSIILVLTPRSALTTQN